MEVMDIHLNTLKEAAKTGKLAILTGCAINGDNPWNDFQDTLFRQCEQIDLVSKYVPEIRERDIPTEALLRLLYSYFSEESLPVFQSFKAEKPHHNYKLLAQIIFQNLAHSIGVGSWDNHLKLALEEIDSSSALDKICWFNGNIEFPQTIKDSLKKEGPRLLAQSTEAEEFFQNLESNDDIETVLVLGFTPQEFCWKNTYASILRLIKKEKQVYWVSPEETIALKHLKNFGTLHVLQSTPEKVLSEILEKNINSEEETETGAPGNWQSLETWLQDFSSKNVFLEFTAAVLDYVVSRSHSYIINETLLSSYQKEKSHPKIARVARSMGKILFEQGHVTNAIKKHLDAVDNWHKADNKSEAAREYMIIGDNYCNAGSADKAVHYYGEALSLCRGLEDNPGIADVTYKLALICDTDEDYDLAHRYYLESLQAKKKSQDYQGQMTNLLNLSATLIKEQEWDRAKKYLEEASEITEKHPLLANREEVYQHLGLVYMNTQDYLKAREYYEKVYKSYKAQNEELALTFVYCNLGHVCVRLEDYNAAIDYYEGALENYEKMGDWQHLAAVYNNLGFINSNRKEYTLAEEYFSRSAEIFAALQDVYSLIRAHENLARIYTMQGELENAAECYRANLEMLSQLDEKEDLASTLVAYAMIQLHNHKYKEATSKLRSAIEIYDALDLSKEKEDTVKILNTVEAKIDAETD